MMTFSEFLEFKIRGIVFRPNYVPSAKPKSGAEKSNFLGAVCPARPFKVTYEPVFRMGKKQKKSGIIGKKY